MIRPAHFIILFCGVLISISATNTFAQDKPPATDTTINQRAHNLMLEVAGPGIFYSINYDTRFAKRRNGWGMRVGLGGINEWVRYPYFTVPVQINYLLGTRRNFLELGIGATYILQGTAGNTNALFGFSDDKKDQETALTGTIGYRFQPLKHGVNFGVSFNPLYGDGEFIPYLGLRMGWTF
jgi:hypothetical protein